MFPELMQTSKMESFAKVINDFWPLTIIAKLSILHTCWGLETPLHHDCFLLVNISIAKYSVLDIFGVLNTPLLYFKFEI